MFVTAIAACVLLALPAAPAIGEETVLLKDLSAPAEEVIVTADGKFLFVLDRNRRLRIRDLEKGDWRTLGLLGPEWLELSRDGKYIFSGGSHFSPGIVGNTGFLGFPEQMKLNGIALWSTNLYKEGHFPDTIAYPKGHRFPITAAVFSEDCKILVTATGKNRNAGEIKVWNVPPAQEKFNVPWAEERLPRIEYQAATFYSANGEDDLFDLPVNLREAPGVELLALSPDGSTLVTVYESTRGSDFGNGTARMWDMKGGKEKGRIVIPQHRVRSITFTPDGKMLVLGVEEKDKGSIWLWDVEANKSAGILQGHAHPVQALAVSRDGKYLASGCANGFVKIWDLSKKEELVSRAVSEVPEPIWSITYTPNGEALVIAGGNPQGWVRLWEIK